VNIELLVTILVTVGGATWALRSKLSDIESAIREHVAADEHVHTNQEARIIKLEGRRGPRR
jgi:hypothetical protein